MRLGIAKVPMRLTVWLGSDLIQKPVWFAQYDGFCRHNTGHGACETRGQMGMGFEEGDRVGVRLDMDTGVMVVEVNGRDSGVTMTGITGPVRPVFSLDDAGDCLEITRVELHQQLVP